MDVATAVVANGDAEPDIAVGIAETCRTHDNRRRLLRTVPYVVFSFEIHEIDTSRTFYNPNWILFGKMRYAENSDNAHRMLIPELELAPTFQEEHRPGVDGLLCSLPRCQQR